MAGSEDEVGQRFDRRPHGEVHDHQLVLECPDVGGVAARVFEAPDIAGTRLGQHVDRFEIGDELTAAGIVDGRPEATDVQLGQVHRASVADQ